MTTTTREAQKAAKMPITHSDIDTETLQMIVVSMSMGKLYGM